MGFNTGVLVRNDGLSEIESDPQGFVAGLLEAIREYSPHSRNSFGAGRHGNVADLFHMAHASITGVYAVGGNHVSCLTSTYNDGRHHAEADQVALLKALASALGYSVVKKRPSKKSKR